MTEAKLFLRLIVATLGMAIVFASSFALAQEKSDDSIDEFAMVEHPIAILPFKTRGKEVEGMGEKVSDLMFAQLVVDPAVQLVDREDIDKVLAEAELNISGLVNPTQAIQIGNLTGAKLLVTGSVFQVDESIYVVSKIIGTETTRVVGASAKGDVDGRLDEIVKKLGEEVLATIKKNSSKLVAKPVDLDTRIAEIKKKIGNAKLPKVFVSITEEHVGRSAIDPAAETEMLLILKSCGFEIIDAEKGDKSDADVVITGEGISEFATRTGNLISANARLEVKAIDRASERVITADRQTRLAVDLSEQIAGKQALQEAAAEIAARMIPAIVNAQK